MYQQEAICALATPSGVGAIAVIRISGEQTFSIVNQIFKGKDLTKVETHTVHFGTIRENNVIVDEVLVAVFKGPKSFTKEDTVEISCHGSDYIIRQIIKLLVKHGARLARPGEFTQRAFLNGQFDLVQAEAVADLIAADSAASHRTALNQLRGGFSKKLASLREELIHFASMVELELDFGEEDVEFANRDDLKTLIINLQSTIEPLIESFDFGNALKEGIPVAIIGLPNVGKSTLLNTLLNEEKAIVTAIAGTTRDVIEDILYIDGIKFRIIDTAGIRETEDVVESMGIKRSMRAMEQADVVLMLFDSEETLAEVEKLAEGLEEKKRVIWVRNKADLTSPRGGPSPTPLFSGEGSKKPSPERRGLGEVEPKAQAFIYDGYKPMHYKIPPPILENARNLRQTLTSAEEFLWQILRNRQLNGLKFRRQHPVQEGFVLDFYCAEHRLGIELDGGVHLGKEQIEYDELRTQELKSIYGITIIRFRNEKLFENLEEVLGRIVTITSPNTSPVKRSVGEGTPRNEIAISAKTGEGIETLKKFLTASLLEADSASDTVITNLRHYEHLVKTQQALRDALNGLEIGITGDFLAQDIRLALHHLGEITGQIVNDDLLANIFSKFCIGK
ncbi:tRNA uridine-5-carboxymethylaminomethyl(34) synthesis GTPase MnmE [Runella sp.]|uniref:tRNA uridine-5-carboxymethylaminomethyl(34) synthesis GTPase MnmE n=1 Tax=Runella sp. TaxID=1960881 RepID=UPI0026086D40|nr:tRNA uridine-5-carboxymethylaminomethyl(34) synthesis GTPase MnmE [Runella sp.]